MKVIKCIIVIENMVVTRRLLKRTAAGELFSEGVVGCRGYKPLRRGLVHLSCVTNVGDVAASMARSYAIKMFKDCKDRHELTKHIFINNVGPHYGERRNVFHTTLVMNNVISYSTVSFLLILYTLLGLAIAFIHFILRFL